MGGIEVEAFLSWLALERKVAASTHKQALSALLFLYGKVLGIQLPWMSEIGRPRTQRRLPVVLSNDEIAEIFEGLDGEHRLLAQLLYGTDMRIAEGLQLRVKDVDFAHPALIVREGKGPKDRVWSADQSNGCGGVYMPDALERKYPRAAADWPWFWVFPQATLSTDPRSGVIRRDLHACGEGRRWRC